MSNVEDLTEPAMASAPDWPFMWEPNTPQGANLTDELKDADGNFVCPWPNCGHISPGPQGITRHMSATHGWTSPLPARNKESQRVYAREYARRKAQERKARPSDEAKKTKVTCPVAGCGRVYSKAYLRQHLRDFHRFNGTKIRNIMHEVESPSTKSELPPLKAADVCLVVLEQMSTNGSIPIEAIPAYNEWVYATEQFLARMMS